MATLNDIRDGYKNKLGKPTPRAKGVWAIVDLGQCEAVDINGYDSFLRFPNARIIERFPDTDEGSWAAQDYIADNAKPIVVSCSQRYWSLICFFESE